jgi:hypothetical protein
MLIERGRVIRRPIRDNELDHDLLLDRAAETTETEAGQAGPNGANAPSRAHVASDATGSCGPAPRTPWPEFSDPDGAEALASFTPAKMMKAITGRRGVASSSGSAEALRSGWVRACVGRRQ